MRSSTAEQKAFDGGLMDRFVENTGNTNCSSPATDDYGVVHKNGSNIGTVINDPNPTYDDCSSSKYPTVSIQQGRNVGDLLNEKGITWGWFEGGFRPTSHKADGTAICGASHENIGGVSVSDYIPHHEPFQYYESTANPHHLPPTSVAMIGHQDQANHQYDLSDFWAAADSGTLPAVSFLKAPDYEDGHAGYSDPIDEQRFLVQTINHLERLPLLVISPWARHNYVDHSVTDQSSILRFIEDNWHLGRLGNDSFDAKAGSLMGMFNFVHGEAHGDVGRLFLNPATGEIRGESGYGGRN